ncbi:MAG: ABC transporter permease [Phaeobacter italicus]|jgi:peptide/nickel transport system permease protein|uniref:Dipeptide transport system permease protein DppB n=1 Tax=Phaeobacter italicus TaxID=481446 RepID=A0A0H5D2H1_9RHOB|nr:ABC transporter permease [Phaeobacter italicus]MEC8016290.1 ABC transporter permease [Pseudomonadota bacterium]MBY5975498.1 ABC transporter permease [Phaeobacter italicus]MBY6042798.1 ABC transporter permease [Phaeobacter italicus]MCA0856351.1 ABC transporter permease [Phaeobacter italicus]MCI5101769.1 ABC transporter permease [Phaeobacter italicus]
MALFILRRTGVMILTALCLTFIVFFLTNLYPNLEKLAKTEGNFRMSDEAVASWLDKNGYLQPMPVKYGQWLGVLPGWRGATEDGITGRCITGAVSQEEADNAPRFCGVLQGDWGYSTRFKDSVWNIIEVRLGNTGYLMMWVLIVMIPTALVIGVLAGMREGSVTDRSLSTASILTTATPEYVSGVIFIAVFTSSTVGLKWFKGTANSAMTEPTIENFFLPVITIALYGIGYIARMTRASMTEVMTAQYIRTARLKGVSFPNIVMRHALRNALIAPFTVIMLQFPWLLSGVVIVETLFNYKGFGWSLVEAAGNNDIELLLGISVISVVIVLLTQLISDIGYVYLNPRIRIS